MLQDNNKETPLALGERLLAGRYKSKDERRPWDERFDSGKDELTSSSWRERIRLENNVKLLR